MLTIKKFKPTSPGVRGRVSLISVKNKVEAPKSLLTKLKKSYGRNNSGLITSRHRGGGSKKLYREIDFKRLKLDITGTVVSINYDPNRSALIALISYLDGEKAFILCPQGLAIGDKVISSSGADIKLGNCKQVRDIPVGTLIHNIELEPLSGGQIAKSAGAFAQLMAKELDYVLIRLPSGELRKIMPDCRATVGQVGNIEREQVSLGKAGANRRRGWRPYVRGVAMNPIDHPHGGGEGKTSGGRHPCTPWGLLTKGKKTRANKRTQKFIVKRR